MTARRTLPMFAVSIAGMVLSLLVQAQRPATTERYMDADAPIVERVDDLVARMTLAEKISQMQNEAPAIPRLHVAEYDWWNEGLHGVARSGYATVFPQAIGLAATWDVPLIHAVADTISTEARAKYNEAVRQKNHAIYYGLTFWSPNVNIVRDPRWGRGQETYGEDPFLTGSIGSAFVQGLQGDDARYLKLVATAKHFAVHSGPENSRHTFDAVVSAFDMADTYLPAFRRLVVEAHADSVMCAYNAVEGAPACASTLLLQKTLKTQWHFNGYVVSDCAAITDVAVGHKYAVDMAHAAAASVKAGTDLSCGKEYAALTEAVRQGLIRETEIDAAVKRLFTARMRLGMFDPAERVAFNSIPFTENDSAKHRTLALKAAEASMVLLKNDRRTLPLGAFAGTVAVVGPNAAALPALEGNYNAVASKPVTPMAALEERLPGRVRYAQGAPYVDGIPVPVPETVFSVLQGGVRRTGLRAEYFSGADFSGAKVLERVDRQIDFDWNGAAPEPRVTPEAFAVRWSGFITPPAAGTLGFGFSMAHCSSCDDTESVRVWLDGKPVYEFVHAATHGRRAPTTPFEMTFEDTKPHALRVEYTHRAPHFGAGLTFNWKPPVEVLRKQAVEAAAKADVIVAFLGLSPELEGEEMPVHVDGFDGGDRSTIELPAVQQALVTALAATGKPLVLVLMNGSALALQGAAEKASAILEAWYPGEVGGTAIARTLFGENNPSGRLPLTFYAGTEQLPRFDDYSMKGRTYRYFAGEPLYGFGHGLSYTTFSYGDTKLSQTRLKAGDALTVTAKVRNTGAVDGDEVVEVCLVPKGQSHGLLRRLVGFEKVHLRKGESRTVTISIEPRELSLVAEDGSRSVMAGEYDLMIGGGGKSVALPFRVEGSAAVAP